MSELLQAFLEDFLETSGYHDIGAAVADTLAAFEASRVPAKMASLATPTDSASAATAVAGPAVYSAPELAVLGLAGLVIAVAGALLPAGWAARSARPRRCEQSESSPAVPGGTNGLS